MEILMINGIVKMFILKVVQVRFVLYPNSILFKKKT